MEAQTFGIGLQDAGLTTLHNYTSDVISSLFYGIFAMLFSLSTFIFLRKGFANRASLWMFTVTIAGFLITTLAWSSGIATSVIITRTSFIDNASATWKERDELGDIASYQPLITCAWAYYVLPIVSDGVVIWRAWVLFLRQRWVMVGPLFLLLGTFATTIACLGIVLSVKPRFPSSASPVEDNLINALLNTSFVLSIASNAVATLLIAYKLWIYRKFVVKNLERSSRVQNLLVLLVESGLVYLGLQIIAFVLNFTPEAGSDSVLYYVQLVFFDVYFDISGMYPTIVMILINYENSKAETYGISALIKSGEIVVIDIEARPATIGHLSFATPQSTTVSSDNGNFNRHRQPNMAEKEGRE